MEDLKRVGRWKQASFLGAGGGGGAAALPRPACFWRNFFLMGIPFDPRLFRTTGAGLCVRRQRDGPLLWGEAFYFLLGFSSCPCFGCCCFISRPEYLKAGGACLCGVGLGALGLHSSFILGRPGRPYGLNYPIWSGGVLGAASAPRPVCGVCMLLLPVARCSCAHGGEPAGRKAPMASPGPCQGRPVSAVQRAPPARPKPGAPASCLYRGTALHASEPQFAI